MSDQKPKISPSQLKFHHIGSPIEMTTKTDGEAVAVGILQGYVNSTTSRIYLQGIREPIPAHDSMHEILVVPTQW